MLFLNGEAESEICLDLEQMANEPMVVNVGAFGPDKQILFKIEEGRSFKALCSYLHQPSDGFTVPQYISGFEDIPKNTYFVLIHDEHGYTAFFCLSNQDVLVSMQGHTGGFWLNLHRGSSELSSTSHVFLCVSGDQLFQVIERTMRLALQLTGGIGKLVSDKLPLPVWFNGLGWESGIGFDAEVSHVKVLEAATSLKQAGYCPSFILLDDGWQHLEVGAESAKLSRFDADPYRFPKGIKGLVEDLQAIGIHHVGVWHGMMGYKGGIGESLAQNYQLPNEEGKYWLGNDLGKTFQFFYDYYAYLREQGISFIKVGDQDLVPTFCKGGITRIYKNLQSAIQAAASLQFNNAHFNTDCLRNENLFYWGNSCLARSAHDLDIVNPVGMMAAIRNNLTNSLWLQHLMHPDFDAWMTHLPENEMMAIFHALSGTINVIGDLPGQHQTNLLRKMVLPNGNLLKADKPLTLCSESVFVNPLETKQVYKAFTNVGKHGIIAAFNLSAGRRTLHGTVSPYDVPGLNGGQFAVFSHHNGFVGVVKGEESLEITLKPKQSDVFTFAPVKNGTAVLGCYTFYLAPGPLTEVNIEEDSIHISASVVAPVIVYSERRILEVRRDGVTIPWEYDERRKTLSIDTRSHIEAKHSVCSILFES